MSGATSKTEYMHNIFRYIEENISTNFDTELLSSIGYVSPRKLKNDFYNLSGHSVIEYVRKRRLSNALALIKMADTSDTSEMKLTDIALECGYSSHQALCRAIKQKFRLTPTKYKKGLMYYFFPPWGGEPLQSVTVSSVTIPRMLRIYFYHTNFKDIENIAIATFLQINPSYSGRIFGKNGEQKDNKFCYELYLTETKNNLKLPYGFEIVEEISGVNKFFATTTVQNNEHKINAAWNYLYSAWLQSSMFEYTGEPYYEEYILRNNKPFKLKLYLPLRTRAEDTKITLIDNPHLHFVTAKATGWNAEEVASKTVMEYLLKNHPHIINISSETYMQKGTNCYVCGVKINSMLQPTPTNDENVTTTVTSQDKYLLLDSRAMGDYNQTAALLTTFARNHGLEAELNSIFAVYDAKEGFHNIRIKMYCPVRICPK